MLSKRTYAQQQQRINRERVADVQAFESSAQRRQTEMKNSMMEIDERASQRRNWREKMMEADEAERRDAFLKYQESQKLQREQREAEEQMEKELEQMNENKIRDEKIRQKIINKSEELKNLQRQIQAAYAMKSMKEQMAKNDLTKQQEVAKDIEYAKILNEQNEKINERMKEEARQRIISSENYKKELQWQRQSSKMMRQEMKYKMLDWDKQLVEEEVRKIKEKDQISAQIAREKQEKYKKAIEEEEVATTNMKLIMQKKMMMEDERIERYERDRVLEEEKRKIKRFEQNEARERVKNELATRLSREQQERDEAERVRLLISQEKSEQRYLISEQEKEAKKMKEKEELQRMREEMMMMRERMKKRDKEEEDHFRKEMMAKFAEDDRLEQMNAQKQRMKRMEHQRQIELILEEKRKHQDMLREQELKSFENEEKMKAIEKMILEEERSKLLKLHAPNLIGYLPKGVLRDDNDLQMLGPDFIDAYQKIYM